MKWWSKKPMKLHWGKKMALGMVACGAAMFTFFPLYVRMDNKWGLAMWICFFVLWYLLAHLKMDDVFFDENDKDE